MARKLFSVEEANALLPRLSPVLVELRRQFEEAVGIREEIARIARFDGGSAERESWSETLNEVAQLLGKLEEWGVELKDVSTGLVDFPTVMEGEEAYLCWRLGEPEVSFWHTIEGGFQGRRPL
jgi:hypothetical protein